METPAINLTDILILSLAIWRLASLIAFEDGPDYLFVKIRHWVGVKYTPQGEPYGTNVISNGLICVWCNSMWLGMIVTPIYYFFPEMTIYCVLPLTLSALAIVVEKWNGAGR